MSVSIDKGPADEGEDAKSVLASWLDDYIGGRCDRSDMQESFLSVCRSNPDAPWDALALLDQYQRRGRIDMALARSLKTDIAQLVFGVANQTELPPEAGEGSGDTSADTTGTRWRKLIAARDAEDEEEDEEQEEQAASPQARPFPDPTLFRRDVDMPSTRPPPPLSHAPPEPERLEPVRPEHRPQPRHEPRRPSGAAAASSDILRDRYELLAVLGRGSTGTVYKALDRHRAHLSESARCVAVKVLKANYRDRPGALVELEREFHQAQLLSHPNIVSVFDLDRDGDTYFIVMELLDGELLSDVLARLGGKPMPREHALAIISSVGAALAHAHRRDVVHADLKPRNIMITGSGEVRVLDFGFARNRPLDLHSASQVHEAPMPAPAYASVERVNGSEPHPSDDVYSLACIAYELLSGQHPFGGRSAVLARAHGRQPRRIPGLNHKQSHALQRALLWTRGERKIDVVELLNGLACADVPGRSIPPAELRPEAGRSWRSRIVAMILFVLIAFAVFAVLQSRYDPPAPDRDTLPVAAAPTAESPAAESPAAHEPVAAAPAGTPAQNPAPSVAKEVAKGTAHEATRKDAAKAASTAAASKETTPPASAATKKTKPADVAAARPAAPAPATRPDGNGNATAGPVTIEFDKDTYVASESDGSVRLHVRRTGSTQNPVSFRWTLRGNSAEAGIDFAAIGPDIEEIPAGSREVTLTIPLVSDSIVENTELFLVEIESMQDGVTLGERSHAAVIIVDDD
jgi:serine/threonine protein kinase